MGRRRQAGDGAGPRACDVWWRPRRRRRHRARRRRRAACAAPRAAALVVREADGDGGADADGGAQPWWARLAVRLVAEARRGAASPLAAYIDALPREFDTLLHWTPAELEELQDPKFATAVERQRAGLARAHKAVVASGAVGGPPVSLEEFTWAAECVLSRAFGADVSGDRRVVAAAVAAVVAGAAGGSEISLLAGLVVCARTGGPQLYAAASGAGASYVMAPLIDSMNHDGWSRSSCGYSPLYDAFEVRAAADGAPPARSSSSRTATPRATTPYCSTMASSRRATAPTAPGSRAPRSASIARPAAARRASSPSAAAPASSRRRRRRAPRAMRRRRGGGGGGGRGGVRRPARGDAHHARRRRGHASERRLGAADAAAPRSAVAHREEEDPRQSSERVSRGEITQIYTRKIRYGAGGLLSKKKGCSYSVGGSAAAAVPAGRAGAAGGALGGDRERPRRVLLAPLVGEEALARFVRRNHHRAARRDLRQPRPEPGEERRRPLGSDDPRERGGGALGGGGGVDLLTRLDDVERRRGERASVPAHAPAPSAPAAVSSPPDETPIARCFSRSYISQYIIENGTSRHSVGTSPRHSTLAPSRRTADAACATRPPKPPPAASPPPADATARARVRSSSSGATAVLARRRAAAGGERRHLRRHDARVARGERVARRLVRGEVEDRRGHRHQQRRRQPAPERRDALGAHDAADDGERRVVRVVRPRLLPHLDDVERRHQHRRDHRAGARGERLLRRRRDRGSAQFFHARGGRGGGGGRRGRDGRRRARARRAEAGCLGAGHREPRSERTRRARRAQTQCPFPRLFCVATSLSRSKRARSRGSRSRCLVIERLNPTARH